MSRIESADVVVIGAGIVGAACAEALSAVGVRVLVVDRGTPADATTASGTGNVLVSNKEPGPALELAVASRRRWPELIDELGELVGPEAAAVAWAPRGALAVATTAEALGPLAAMTAAQRAAGVVIEDLDADQARELEPRLTERITAAAHFPDDAGLHPVRATAALLAALRARGGEVRSGVTVDGVATDRAGAVVGVRTGVDAIPCRAVVNACGPWAGRFSESVGAPIDVLPLRGTVLATAPLPGFIARTVYDAGYIEAVNGPEADLRTSTVIEPASSGAVLIGSSRERVAFDDAFDVTVLRRLARGATGLFPELAEVPVTRAYGGFRPSTPDRLPVIGEDPRVPGLWHAAGHEGAGVGLAAATGRLLADRFIGREPVVDPEPFRVDRPEVALEAGA